MNTDTGQIREFTMNQLNEMKKSNPVEAEKWKPLDVGEEVSFKGLHFRIHRINPAANQVILIGIPAPHGI